MNKFIVKCRDGDMYIIEGEYENQKAVHDYLSQFEMVEMPNGDMVKSWDVLKVTSFSSYQFQVDQKARHRKGQRISLKTGNWVENGHTVLNARLESIRGRMEGIGAAKNKSLPIGK